MGDKAAEAAKSEIMKGDKLHRQGGSGSQKAAAAAKSEIMKGDKLNRQGGSGSQKAAAAAKSEIMKGDKLGKQGGRGSQFPQSGTHPWEIRTPIASLSGGKTATKKANHFFLGLLVVTGATLVISNKCHATSNKCHASSDPPRRSGSLHSLRFVWKLV